MVETALHEDWRVVGGEVSAWFEAPSLTEGAALVERVADLAPDLDLRARGVRVRVSSPEHCEAISTVACQVGLFADPAALGTMRVTFDAVDPTAVSSFWRTVLGEPPLDPAFLFGLLREPRPLRNRIHVDVVRPAEAVASVRSALGRQPYGAYGLTLADPEGNEVDLVPGDELSPETPDWLVVFGAMTHYPTAWPAGLVAAAAEAATDTGLPLLVDVRPDGVTFDSGKDQWEDVPYADLAGRIQLAARELGLVAQPARARFVQLGIDAVDVATVRAFWTTALGYEHDPRPALTDIYDPRRLNPVVFFQQLDAADVVRREQRNRIRLELLVPADQVEDRIDSALAAGGRIVGAGVVADPEGNELSVTS
jgi:hypothetical protein